MIMPTVYFNDTLRRNLNQALFTREYGPIAAPSTEVGEFGLRQGWYTAGSSFQRINYGVVKLMKGSVPTDFTGLTSPTSRSSDTLVTWTTDTIGWNYSNPVTNIDGIAEISSPYVAATASGIASWFWWYIATPATGGDPSYQNYIFVQLAGTVGTSGADLIIGDTTIIAGANYRFQNLKFDIPTTYTY